VSLLLVHITTFLIFFCLPHCPQLRRHNILPPLLPSSSLIQAKMDCTVGLTHLVEAATALTRLNPSSSPRVPHSQADCASADLSTGVVSDDDSHEKRAEVDAPAVVVTPSRSVTTANNNAARSSSSSNINNKREIFPQRLMAVLGDSSLTEIISWLPHGRSFVIIRPDVFTDEIMPKHFPPMDARASSKYPSFTRKLNRWYVQTFCLSVTFVSKISVSHILLFNSMLKITGDFAKQPEEPILEPFTIRCSKEINRISVWIWYVNDHVIARANLLLLSNNQLSARQCKSNHNVPRGHSKSAVRKHQHQ
jgi:HSF-type DNA-binding